MHDKYTIAVIVSLLLLVVSSGLWFARIAFIAHASGKEQIHALAYPSKQTSTHERPQCLFC